MNVRQLRRVRWAVRAVLVLAVAASVAANVLHAEPNVIARVIAAWPPCALLLTIELMPRVPVVRAWRAWTRRVAATLIALIAAWVSYGHMTGVALRYGESPSSAHLLPLSVDGLVVVASVCLVELAGRIAESGRAGLEPATSDPRDDLDNAYARAPHGALSAELPPTASLTKTGLLEAVVLPKGGDSPPAIVPSSLPVAPNSGSTEEHEPAALVIGADEPVTPQLSDTESDTPAEVPAALSPAAQKVLKAHVRFPDLDNRALAKRARVSLSSVNRHRPAKPSVNGRVPAI